uniref:neuronal PAS domain-containing protein 3-like isoform X2 n=1 Tax=Myxine glutinosa TaxID=7769 RepID=UPI00358F139A
MAPSKQEGKQDASRRERLQALRKEKSRDAARSRRGKENFEFYELAKLLPLPGAITSQLDKASIVRLSISYLRMRDFANLGEPPWHRNNEGPPPNTSVKALGQRPRCASAVAYAAFDRHLGSQILQSMDGFIFVLNHEGRFLYISETVSIYLGLSQVELTGSSSFDYVHPTDHAELADQLGLRLPPGRGLADPRASAAATSPSGPASRSGQVRSSIPISQIDSPTEEDGDLTSCPPSPACTPEPGSGITVLDDDCVLERSFFIRMKSTLTKRGIHVKTSGYKVVHVAGRLRRRAASSAGASPLGPVGQCLGMVVVAHALPPPTLSEVRVDCHMFVTKLSLDLRITYCESRISDYMDLLPNDVVGSSCYHFIHMEDIDGIRQSHVNLLDKGQCITKYYRWLQKSGGFIWVQSGATVTLNSKNTEEKTVIWVNYVLSALEHKSCAMDTNQLHHQPKCTPGTSDGSDSEPETKDTIRSPFRCADGRLSMVEGSVIMEPVRRPGKNMVQAQRELNVVSSGAVASEPGTRRNTLHSPSSSSDDEEDEQEEDDEDEVSDAQSDSDDLYEGPKVRPQPRQTVLSRGLRVDRPATTPSKQAEKPLDGDWLSSGSADESHTIVRPKRTSRPRRPSKRARHDGILPSCRRWEVDIGRASKIEGPLSAAPVLISSTLDMERLPKFRLEVSSRAASVTDAEDSGGGSWDYPLNREILRSEGGFNLAEALEPPPLPIAPSLHTDIPESVLASPEPDKADKDIRALEPEASPSPSPGESGCASTGHLSPPPTASSPLRNNMAGALTSVTSLLYTAGELEMLQRLQQQASLVLPLAAQPRVYTAGAIRYAPGADMAFAAPPFNLLELNSAALRLDPKASAEALYQHMQRMAAPGGGGGARGGARGGAAAAVSATGLALGSEALPSAAAAAAAAAATGVITTAEGIFPGLTFPVYSISIQPAAQAERKDE